MIGSQFDSYYREKAAAEEREAQRQEAERYYNTHVGGIYNAVTF